ncbi:MAG TPA: biopolymer transporter ExbB [Cyanobacteria bacterium UBA9273]|nr:biopolymer transporter ExbB [Cyanobacteria bacterium UBA9273]
MSTSDFFAAGGIVAWPLLVFSIVAIALIAERILFWWKVIRRQRSVVRDVLKLYRQEPPQALNLLQQNADLPICRIFLEALELDNPPPDKFRLALDSAVMAEIPNLRRFGSVFDTIISISPLLGLLGTILGLITAFSSLKLGDVGGSRTSGVTAGISEALISTVMGLVVAIFTLMFSNVFRGFYRRQVALIQEYTGQLELLYSDRYEKGEQAHYASSR